jgi:ferrous iron transport protein A
MSAHPSAKTTTLDQLSVTDVARVVQVQGDDPIATRIMEMGIVDGEPIRLLGRAPLGDPLEFAVRGYRVSLRKSEARRVVVELLDGSPP